jgi:hypothetical protein
MLVTRVVKLADGEELVSYETDDHIRMLVDDPRNELLEHRRSVEAASDRAADFPADALTLLASRYV